MREQTTFSSNNASLGSSDRKNGYGPTAHRKARALFLKDEGVAAWDEIVLSFPWHDVFHTGAYADFSARQLGVEAALLVVEGGSGPIAAHPLLLRPVSNSAFAAGETGYDAIAPDYTGPLLMADAADWRGTGVPMAEMDRLSLDLGVVTEFGRLNPFHPLGRELVHTFGAASDRSLVYLDLTVAPDLLERGFDKGNRSSVKKARRAGVTVSEERGPAALAAFYSLYLETMERRDAKGHYRVGLELLRELVEGCGARLFSARLDGEPAATALFLPGQGILHYYFSGSNALGRKAHATNLLLMEVAAVARGEGFSRLHLGGGYRPGDSLESFKKSFSKTTVPFYTYRRVHDPENYRRLCRLSEQYLRDNGQDPQGSPDYFPAYRR